VELSLLKQEDLRIEIYQEVLQRILIGPVFEVTVFVARVNGYKYLDIRNIHLMLELYTNNKKGSIVYEHGATE